MRALALPQRRSRWTTSHPPSVPLQPASSGARQRPPPRRRRSPRGRLTPRPPGRSRWERAALARAGDEAALGQLVAQQRWTEVSEILDGWRGPWTPSVVGWRLEQLHRQERLKALVLTFLEHLPQVQAGPVYDRVLEAASRLGTLPALRESLWRAVELGRGGEPLVRLLARVCRRSGVHGPVLILAERHPGVLPPQWVADALWEERRYEALLSFEPGMAALAALRLEAMLQLELASPGRFTERQWTALVRACQATPEGQAALQRCLQRLRAHAPRFGPLPLLTRLAQP